MDHGGRAVAGQGPGELAAVLFDMDGTQQFSDLREWGSEAL